MDRAERDPPQVTVLQTAVVLARTLCMSREDATGLISGAVLIPCISRAGRPETAGFVGTMCGFSRLGFGRASTRVAFEDAASPHAGECLRELLQLLGEERHLGHDLPAESRAHHAEVLDREQAPRDMPLELVASANACQLV